MYLTEILAVLGVVTPVSIWAVRTFILSTVNSVVDSVLETSRKELAVLQEDNQEIKEAQAEFRNDIQWIKSLLMRMERHISRRDEKDEPY